MSLVTLADLKIFLDIDETDNSEDYVLTPIQTSVETWIKKFCEQDIEQTTYTNKLYDGDGGQYLFLSDYPIISVSRISPVCDAIRVKNTSTDATTVSVTVDSDSVDLDVDGGSNDGSTSLDMATYTTIDGMVTAINAAGSGWVAEIEDDDYASYKSTNLLEQTIDCTAWAGSSASWEYLKMADESITSD